MNVWFNILLDKGNHMDKRLDLLNREEFVENVIKIVNQLSQKRMLLRYRRRVGSWQDFRDRGN